MGGLIAKRLAAMIGILLVLTAIVFGVQQLSPTDPVHNYLGANSTPAQVAVARHQLGYDKPLPVQYVRYVGDLLRGNMGTSLRTRQPVTTDLGHALPATLELALAAMLIAAVLAILLGVASAARWRGAGIFRFILVAGGSVPAFLAAILGIVLFYNHLHWVPAPGRTRYLNAPSGPTGLLTIDGLLHGRLDVTVDAIQHLILPSIAVALVPAVSVGRVLRSSITNALQSDYVRTARAKGLSERMVLLRHTLRNSAGAALSMGGLQIGLMFAGVMVVEVVYNWPGIGLYTYQSINRSDLPAIAGVTVLLGAAYVIINTVVDILQAVADPRIVL
ncbi:MAG TPA: ABC transporter permease [Acidimicrobiia bacterium]|jgi:peptide/nickel transport system permease protein|nr:ABC transporter permease [Acidimicrobiia bacterium]